MFIHSHFKSFVDKKKSLENCRARCLIIIYFPMAKTEEDEENASPFSQIIYDHSHNFFLLYNIVNETRARWKCYNFAQVMENAEMVYLGLRARAICVYINCLVSRSCRCVISTHH